jgi:hypothetical protein
MNHDYCYLLQTQIVPWVVRSFAAPRTPAPLDQMLRAMAAELADGGCTAITWQYLAAPDLLLHPLAGS